jgi:Uri superfamily endonuclease
VSGAVWKAVLGSPDSEYVARALVEEPAEVLSFGAQDGEIVLWYLPGDGYRGVRYYLVVNTGTEFDVARVKRHLATVTSETGVVWHIFELETK